MRCPFDYHPTRKDKFVCLECGTLRKILEGEKPEDVNRYCGNAKPRAGDYVHLLASAFGFKECTGCRERRAYLNKVHRKIAKGWEAMGKISNAR